MMIRHSSTSFILLLQLLIFQSPLISQQILITEIMYDLEGTDSPNEFVELFNPSETDTLDLAGWSIQDRSSTDALIDSGYGLKIPPLSYGLILEGDYTFETGIYNSIIPENTVLIKVDDSSIGNGLSTSDSLFLLDSTEQIMETIGWGDWAQDGFSLERIRNHLDNIPSNWTQSQDSLGTPGILNSVTPDSIDFTITNLSLSPSVISTGATTTLMGQVVNVGLSATEPEVHVTVDGESVTSEYLGVISELDTAGFELEIGPFNSGAHLIIVTVAATGDTNTLNDTDSISLGVRYNFRSVVLNEFIPRPAADTPEFVEIVNISSTWIDLEHWRVTDSNSGSNFGLSSTVIDTGGYAVIAADSTLADSAPAGVPYLVPEGGFPILNNGGDEVRIFDPFDTLIDSLTYSSSWNITQGISFEKIYASDSSHLPENWGLSTSPSGSTIGDQNSITPLTINGSIVGEDIYYLPAIPSDSDQVILNVPILNKGTSIFNGTVSVSSSQGLYESPMTSGGLGDTTLVPITLEPFLSGIHEISITLELPGDEDFTNNTSADTIHVRYPFGTFLINEFMSAPNNDQSEFVELILFDDLEMIGWGISDNQRDPVIMDAILLADGDYIVVSSNSNIIDLIPVQAHFLTPSGFPSLNNTADGIYLFDHTGSIIDSLIYGSGWPMEAERSTEKRHPSFISNHSENWGLSDMEGSLTPGYQNSIMIVNEDGMILQDLISYSPLVPSSNETVTLQIPIYNNGLNSIQGTFSIEFLDEEIVEGIIPVISSGDTVIVEAEINAPSPGSHLLTVIIDINNDSNPENDTAVLTLNIRFPFGTCMINEFMTSPNNEQSEFIEIIAFGDLEMVGWGISDNRLDPVLFDSLSISSGAYIILSSDSNIVDLVPDQAHFNVLTNFPGLNNSADALFLFDHTGSIIDSLSYDESWPLEEDRSTEKKRPSYASDDLGNWGIANPDILLTPGAQNSIMILDTDGMILTDSIYYAPDPPFPDSMVTLYIPIANIGIDTIDGSFSIEWNDEEIGEGNIPITLMGDTSIIEIPIISPPSGVHTLVIILDIPNDANPGNDIVNFTLPVRYLFGDVFINEFYPMPDSIESEFVEIIPQLPINTQGWSITDLGGSKGLLPDLALAPYSYCLIGGDSSWLDIVPDSSVFIYPENGLPGLNNSSETIYILDHTGSIIDSLKYDENWSIMSYRSTEKYRITDSSNDPDNWGIAVGDEGMTPGTQNSLFFASLPNKGQISFSPNPFSPDGDGIDDELTLSFSLPFFAAAIRWEVIDMAGRIIAKPYYNYQVGQNGVLTWDGKRDNGKPARIGIYVMKVSFRDVSSTASWEKVKTVVLAKPL